MIVWSKSLELKIDIIDSQHKEILEEINMLMESFDTGAEKEQTYEILCFVEDYVNKHFSMEEFYLHRYNYKDIESHIPLHRAFSKKLTDFKSQYHKIGITKTAAKEMCQFLIEWWYNHILKIDAQYVSWIKEQIQSEENCSS